MNDDLESLLTNLKSCYNIISNSNIDADSIIEIVGKEVKKALLLAAQCKASNNTGINPINEMPEESYLESEVNWSRVLLINRKAIFLMQSLMAYNTPRIELHLSKK